MRIIKSSYITKCVKEMCIESNYTLQKDVEEKIKSSIEGESNLVAKGILEDMVENLNIAREDRIPICQDTGMAVFFIEIGDKVYIEGNIEDAINEGVRLGYRDGFLRYSVVEDPILRNNTKDNTPSIIHYTVTKGDQLKIKFTPKGFGSENMGKLKMLKPSDGIKGIKDFVIDTVKEAGPNPCPPIIVGIGVGGTMDKVCEIAKKSLLRKLGEHNSKPHIEVLEKELLEEINNLDIGPQGFGGKTTALGVNIETYPTHIAGLPVAVNINCHVSRHSEYII